MNDAEDDETQLRELYLRVLDGWNKASAEDFAAPFVEDGEVVGFDGSQTKGRESIAEELWRIFADHATGAYVGKVKRVRSIGPQAAVLRAVARVVPAGHSSIEPTLNAVQTLVAERREGDWRIVLYQNTPA
jgi:uncharacterized protein (TIGR02246 family)